MEKQQLHDYIKQQLQQGVSQEQIKNTLMANGWQTQVIEEGFSIVNKSTQDYSPVSADASGRGWKIAIMIVVGVMMLSAGIYYASQIVFKNDKTHEISEVVSDQSPVEDSTITAPPQQSPEQSVTQTQAQIMEVNFADKLSSCTPHKITFKHLLTSDELEKEILGIIDGKCLYVEQMPNGGKMECNYMENERVTMAKYYKDVAMAESVETSLNVDFDSGEQNTTYTINGKVVDNPLHEFMNNGTCIISGY